MGYHSSSPLLRCPSVRQGCLYLLFSSSKGPKAYAYVNLVYFSSPELLQHFLTSVLTFKLCSSSMVSTMPITSLVSRSLGWIQAMSYLFAGVDTVFIPVVVQQPPTFAQSCQILHNRVQSFLFICKRRELIIPGSAG